MMTSKEEQPSSQPDEYIQELMELHEIAIGFEQLGHEKERGDISEAKYKKKFRKRFRKIPKAAVLIQDEKVHMANKGMKSIIGIPLRKMIGVPYANYIHPKERLRVVENHLNRVAGREEAEAVYPTIVLEKKSNSIPVKLQAATITYLNEPVILGLLEKI
ncbi:MAG: PAS domain-containing protein [Deltaproteobacteria bacterium]|nr:PAS domain-containing protein [Deltaproteobacteria bacterium]